jgi:hypothetical protein
MYCRRMVGKWDGSPGPMRSHGVPWGPIATICCWISDWWLLIIHIYMAIYSNTDFLVIGYFYLKKNPMNGCYTYWSSAPFGSHMLRLRWVSPDPWTGSLGVVLVGSNRPGCRTWSPTCRVDRVLMLFSQNWNGKIPPSFYLDVTATHISGKFPFNQSMTIMRVISQYQRFRSLVPEPVYG